MLINLPKRETGKPSNVVIRGVTPAGVALRPQVKLVEGRMFRPGHRRGRRRALDRRAASRARDRRDAALRLRATGRVVGMFDAGRTGFDSEIWGDAEQMLQAFRRIALFVARLRLADAERFDAVKSAIEADPRLTLEAKRERASTRTSRRRCRSSSATSARRSRSSSRSAPMIGAMITMYASVASRTGEIGTLRALGFSRAAILVAFLVEALAARR